MTRVHIELRRVQTWLFAVPRLRAMVGANTILGEVLRVRLPELAREQSDWELEPAQEAYPEAIPDDPLASCDDPADDAQRGILARDGGHFEAAFTSGASAFAEAARVLLSGELPGLLFRISIDSEALDATTVTLSRELPVLAPCQWTGRGLASVPIRQGTERATVSLDVSRRHEAARRAESGTAGDLGSLLAATTRLGERSRPQTFQGLAGSGYLALIHADGNGVGAAAGSGDVERAVFFHRNRVLLRRALHAAIEASCAEADAAPLVLLMLGGDDVLVVCKADAALPFVVELCKTLAGLQQDDRGRFELTLGVGVVFARPTIPVYRLHEVADHLAASAKRRFRGFSPQEGRSVVDWAVYTTTWVDDPEDVRRRDWVRGSGDETRILSRRPVDVLGEGLDSLQGLLSAAQRLEGAPRSQLRYLVEQLPRGHALSNLAFAELSPKARRALEVAGVRQVWAEPVDGGPRMTPVLDLIELYEIGRLGRAGTSGGDSDIVEEADEEAVSHVQA